MRALTLYVLAGLINRLTNSEGSVGGVVDKAREI